MFTRKAAAGVAGLAVLALTAAPSAAAPGAPGAQTNKALAQIRQATHQYHDVDTAIEAGYAVDEHCVPEMGHHYVNGSLVDAAVNPEHPEAVLYAPTDDGLELVAVEYLSTDPDAELFGEHFHETPIPGVYGLHVWAWRGNPEGVFAPFNASVTCPEQR